MTESELLTTHKETTHNEERIPIEDLGLLPINQNKKEDLLDLRLQANELKYRLFRVTCGYVLTTDEKTKKQYLAPSKHIEGFVDLQAAIKLATIIEYYVNHNIKLGHITYEEALEEWRVGCYAIVQYLGIAPEWEGVPVHIKQQLMSLLRPNIWHSLSGAILGKEAKMIVTNITEQRGESKVHETLTTGKGVKNPPPTSFGGSS